MISVDLLLTVMPATVVPPAGLSGSSGWVGTGLLGGVLGWLLWVHLPAKDKLIKEIIAAKDELIKEIIAAKDELIKEAMKDKDVHIEKMSKAFREALDVVVAHCQEEIKVVREDYKDSVRRMAGLDNVTRHEIGKQTGQRAPKDSHKDDPSVG